MRKLVNELTKLPSIGEKSAVRLAYHILTTEKRDALSLAEAIRDARETLRLCTRCFALTDREVCAICGDPNRAQNQICVVEKPSDVIAIERSFGFRGVFHVLHGLWSPLRGVHPERTTIHQLLTRVSDSANPVDELVIATGTTVEGDATALYIANSVRQLGVRVSRLAQGLPKGGEVEYADEVTLAHAFEGRRQFD